MATVLLFRCQAAEADLDAAARALERAGLDVEGVSAAPEPVVTASRVVTRRGAVLGAWAEAVERAHAELRSEGVTGLVELADVQRRPQVRTASAAAAVTP
ncbi:hypothetical protein [Quadrisphaera sp. INWT6]|uniref:hypothetical protein n=1 Tax=Quadrisphaera sp. INWT6 TaxID=2596917 RepID=UPI0018927573|nr:hypothetical protein [Quadrisphaera sp. INWT6]MBF5080524.1 hypothetical protein [Quadrisphaera sp. INWT6]